MRDFDREISVKEMQILDENSRDYGIQPAMLMECAGYSATQTIVRKYRLQKGHHVLILCGTGNNGGDGFVIARHLLTNQINVSVLLIGQIENIRTAEAKQNWNILESLHLNLHKEVVKDSSYFESLPKELKENCAKFKIVVDCLLGTGIKGKVRDPIRSAMEFVNTFKDSSAKIISIDLPSGFDPNSGSRADIVIDADLLITFHREKVGFVNLPVKEIIVNSIGIPMESDLFVGSGDVKFNMPKRTEFIHKGQFGRVLIIGGSNQYSGAPALSAMAALQMGMDLVYVYAPKSVSDVIRSYSPNLIVKSGFENNICKQDIPEIKKFLIQADCVVIGPGLGTDPKTEEVFPEILLSIKESDKPVVIDADALKLLKSHKPLLKTIRAVLTPHLHEFFELTGKKLPLQTHFLKNIHLLEKTINSFGGVFLVKGRYDYISNGKQTRINRTGTPEMAVGGTGDILTGIVASLIAVKLDLYDAACCSAFLNGKLGEYYQHPTQSYHKGIIKNQKPLPMKSSDLLKYIPLVLQEYT
ncbi:MAG: NAD(P)H-hydrate dehydratase [Candidatus Lokiarchaeota archaeon]|nr:NAD(P)H-hydrate dehydratase [Candidatus Lokiarchaeota archaeon]